MEQEINDNADANANNADVNADADVDVDVDADDDEKMHSRCCRRRLAPCTIMRYVYLMFIIRFCGCSVLRLFD